MSDVADEIRTALRRLVVATIVLFVVQAAVVAWVWIDASDRREALATVALSTNHALCVLRSDLEQRVADSTQFLVDHPEGIPGIPIETIKQSIDNQKRTIDALSDLRCREEAA